MKKNILFFSILMTAFILTGCLTTAPAGTSDNAFKEVSADDFILDKKIVYEYNSEGQKIKKYDYNKKNEIKETVYYIYENSVLAGKKFFDKNNNLKSYENYQYDSEGRKIRETEYKPDSSVKNYKTYEYFENNSYKKQYFKKDKTLYRVVIKKYDENGNLLEESNNEAAFYHYK